MYNIRSHIDSQWPDHLEIAGAAPADGLCACACKDVQCMQQLMQEEVKCVIYDQQPRGGGS